MKNDNNNQTVYIRNIEAVDIYKHIHQEKGIYAEYTGAIPFSLELLKLQKVGFKSWKKDGYGRIISNDIINVKFNIGFKEDGAKKVTKSYDKLREELYINGFELYGTKYVMYKRSGAKSRIGNCLFIKEELFEEMINWSRMYLDFPKGAELDVVGLGAYSSLVSSSIEKVITINPDNILIIEDVESKFNVKAKEVRKGSDGFLHSYLNENATINSCFTDGSSLLDSSYFTDGQAMMLLRNHMFKSASFNTNIQKFMKDYFKEAYETATITDMFGNEMAAKDIHMICTPNSLKAFKFSKFVTGGTDKDMYKYWNNLVKQDGCIFGVCKHEKKTKTFFNNLAYQQLSYQMVNSLPVNPQELKELCNFELNYVKEMKENNKTFIDYLRSTSNYINSNDMISDLAERSPNFTQAELYKKYKTNTISAYVNKLKKGKIKVHGDYCVMVSNPYEYLLASVGAYNENDLVLKDNEVYTSLFSSGEELTAFRNPHTSPSNIYYCINKWDSRFKYFNFTDNIVIVNCVKCEMTEILSGCDWDSDTALVTNNNILVDVAKKML